MGVIEEVVSRAKKTADYAGKKTGEVLEITKLKISAAELEDKMDKEFLELGKKIYDAQKDHSDVAEYVAMKTEAVDKIDAELKEVLDHIAALRSEKRCPACEFSNPQDANFCQRCGAKL